MGPWPLVGCSCPCLDERDLARQATRLFSLAVWTLQGLKAVVVCTWLCREVPGAGGGAGPRWPPGQECGPPSPCPSPVCVWAAVCSASHRRPRFPGPESGHSSLMLPLCGHSQPRSHPYGFLKISFRLNNVSMVHPGILLNRPFESSVLAQEQCESPRAPASFPCP